MCIIGKEEEEVIDTEAISIYIPSRLHCWLLAAFNCLPSVTEPFRLPLVIYGRVAKAHHFCTFDACLPDMPFLHFLL